MTLDDATAQFLEQMAASDSKPIHDMSPDEARALGGQLRQMYGQGPEIGSVLDATASGPGGQIPVRILSPKNAARAIIAYFHGGGWVMGDLEEFDTLGRKLVAPPALLSSWSTTASLPSTLTRLPSRMLGRHCDGSTNAANRSPAPRFR